MPPLGSPGAEPPASQGGGKPGRRGRGLFHSSLTRRILAINLVAPLFLVAGFFYYDIYRDSLYEGRFSMLETEAKLIASAVTQNALGADGGDVPLDPDRARQTVERMAGEVDLRARLFGADGVLIVDARPPSAPQPVMPEAESAQGDRPVLSVARGLLDRLVASRRDARGLASEVEIDNPRIQDFPETSLALQSGRSSNALRVTADQTLVLSMAVPVQGDQGPVGVVMISRDGDDIVQRLFELRVVVLELFTLTLLLTFFLSIYLAWAIAQPLVRLAAAADRVRNAKSGRKHQIPDYSQRSDELGDLSDALRSMTEALWARMDAIEGFAADVSHEIKNPLTSLKSAVETAMRMKDPDKQKRMMTIVLHDVDRLDRLISDISEASRLDAELSRTEGEAVDVRSLLAALAGRLEGEAKKTGVTLCLGFSDCAPPLEVMATEGRLLQVFRNLVENALSFSPQGGVVRLDAGQIFDRVVVTIDDQGPGIPPGAHKRIFSRFYSERPSGEEFGQHSGLGLAISRQIVETWGGSICAANLKDDTGRTLGARFTVDFPAVAVPQDPVE